MSLLIKEISLI